MTKKRHSSLEKFSSRLMLKCRELFTSLFLTVFYLVNIFKKWQWYLPFKKVRVPILLIHGYMHNKSAWFFHGAMFIKKGYGPIYTINLGWPFNSIEEFSKKVKKQVDDILKKTKSKHMILIGHSMGGVVASNYVTTLAPKDVYFDVITIGSPLQGTLIAEIGVGKCIKEMRRGSPFIKNLNQKILEAKNLNMFNIVSKIDHLVIPYDSGLIASDDSRKYIAKDIGHNSMLYSKKINDQISYWLKQIS
jgi:triacylglycerol lipase